MALICMGFGLFAALLVLGSWLYGYWSNGLYGTRFEIDSCWQGLSACGVGLIGLFKWLVDSSKNSPEGEFPIAPGIIKDVIGDDNTNIDNKPPSVNIENSTPKRKLHGPAVKVK